MATSAIEEAYLKRLTDFEFPAPTMEQMSMEPEAVPGAGEGPGPLSAEAATGFGKDLARFGKGAVTGTAGGFGDIEMIGRGVASIFTRGGDQSVAESFLSGMKDETILPTTESVNAWLDNNVPMPGFMQGEATSPQQMGEFLSLGGLAKGVTKGGKALISEAGQQLDRAIMEGTGPLAGVVPDALKPMYAVEPGAAMTPSVTAIQLTKGENSLVTASAKRNLKLRESATQAVKDLHGNYPEADGWASIEANTIKFKDAKSGSQLVDVEAKKIPYAFHTPPTGVPKDQWRDQMSAKVVGEVQAVVDRAAAGDESAIAIIKQASWYRSMRDRLRTEFGAIGDVFADVLGTTSAQTGVEQNFNNAVEVLRRFSRGDYDKELAAFERRVAAGEPIDGGTLTKLHKSGEFPLITKAGGQLFNANSPSSMGALLDMFRAVKAGDSPKTPNFTGNLIGLTNEATIDVWAAVCCAGFLICRVSRHPQKKAWLVSIWLARPCMSLKSGVSLALDKKSLKTPPSKLMPAGWLKALTQKLATLGQTIYKLLRGS